MKLSSLLTAVVITTMAAFLTGCSRNPVAPTTSTQVSPGAGTAAISEIPVEPAPEGGGTPNSETVTFQATGAGVITAGRFTLEVRKNTLTADITITMRVSSPEAMDVQIEVSPASANNFKQPVLLTANLSDVANVDYSNTTMMYWDGGAWAPATDVTAQSSQQNVVAALKQLGNCKVATGGGKNGKIGA